ncbi:hypothetical protein FKM82_016462 [Ascaphus truei]
MEMLVEMEEELKYAPAPFRNQMLSKLRSHKKDLTHLQSQRALLYQGSDSLNRATESIARSHVLAAETDAVGTDIIEVLGEQREQLERSKGRLANTSENLSKSRKILRSMSRKIVTNKLLLSIIIILELAILVGLVYYKFFRKS